MSRYLFCEQITNIVPCQFFKHVAALIDHGVKEFLFLFLEELDLFFDRAGGEEAIDVDGFGLADAVGAVDGLVFDARVPPWVEDYYGIGGGEIEAGAAGAHADEEYLDLWVGVKFINQALAVFGFSRKINMRDLFIIKRCRNNIQHLRELAEDKNFAAVFNHFLG